MKLKAFSIVLIACAAAVATAQTHEHPIGVDIRIGDFLPTDSGTQGVGNSWVGIGVDFELKKLSPSASITASLDYAYRNGFRSMPLIANYVVRRGPIYALAGVGANFNLVPQGDGTTYSATTFAYDLGIGYDVLKNAGEPIFVEGRFYGNQHSDINGFGAFIGIRF